MWVSESNLVNESVSLQCQMITHTHTARSHVKAHTTWLVSLNRVNEISSRWPPKTLNVVLNFPFFLNVYCARTSTSINSSDLQFVSTLSLFPTVSDWSIYECVSLRLMLVPALIASVPLLSSFPFLKSLCKQTIVHRPYKPFNEYRACCERNIAIAIFLPCSWAVPDACTAFFQWLYFD